MSSILHERSKSLAVVRLNRPEKFNALSREMILVLSETFKNFEREPNLRAVILTGTGDKAFCAGTDITELAAPTANVEDSMQDRGKENAPVEDRAREVSERGQALCNQIENCGIPVIAAVNGIASGGGCELALACHLRIAAVHAQFSLPETKLGLIPAYGGTQRLAREIGNGRALELMLTGRTISADEALQFGLVNRIAAAGELLSEANSLAREIAELAPLAIHACLEAVIKGSELPLDEGFALEAKLFAGLFATEDVREGTRAFLEKRTPVFRGV
jgi:enoyl-CoA hydratase